MHLSPSSASYRTIRKLSAQPGSGADVAEPMVLSSFSSGLDLLEKKQDQLDQDMEMMHENLTLRASIIAKDEQIAALQAELAKLKK